MNTPARITTTRHRCNACEDTGLIPEWDQETGTWVLGNTECTSTRHKRCPDCGQMLDLNGNDPSEPCGCTNTDPIPDPWKEPTP